MALGHAPVFCISDRPAGVVLGVYLQHEQVRTDHGPTSAAGKAHAEAGLAVSPSLE